VGVVVTVASAIERGLGVLSFGLIGSALLASTLIAQRSLHDHVVRVVSALEHCGIAGARKEVSQIVGRDTQALDEAGVARAAIESLAENFSDGVVAPVCWLALGGLAGGAAYKAINTADSMIGHRTPRHEAFGWAAAKLDDLVNLPASRLSALLIVAAAAVTAGVPGMRCVGMRIAIARRMPVFPKRQWPARSALCLPARVSTAACVSRTPSWGTGGAKQQRPTSARRSRFISVRMQS
jgi:adenosylcobinamide-phosphate synthase